MKDIKAFVAHSFLEEDAAVVRKFLDFLDEVKNTRPSFSWDHAERAEATGIDNKVLSMLSDKNVFIGICTRKEQVLITENHGSTPPWRKAFFHKQPAVLWKTSDWIIQEIGLAIGLRCDVVLLREAGIRNPGGLHGALEIIEFHRTAPEKAFPKLLQMITKISPTNLAAISGGSESLSIKPKEDPPPQTGTDWKTPKSEWKLENYQLAFRRLIAVGDETAADIISDEYRSTENASLTENKIEWAGSSEYTRLVFGKGGSLQTLRRLTTTYPESSTAFRYLGAGLREFDQFNESARAYEIGSNKSADHSEKLSLLGYAAESYALAGAHADVLRTVAELKACAELDEFDELEVLRTVREVAEITKDDQVRIAVLQRMVQLDPSDT